MSEQAIEFLQEWIDDKIAHPPVPLGLQPAAEALAKECEHDAAEAGVPLDEIAEEVGSLEDLIAAKLEDAVEATKSSQPGVFDDRLPPQRRIPS